MRFIKMLSLFVGVMLISFSAMSEEITIGYQGMFNPYKRKRPANHTYP